MHTNQDFLKAVEEHLKLGKHNKSKEIKIQKYTVRIYEIDDDTSCSLILIDVGKNNFQLIAGITIFSQSEISQLQETKDIILLKKFLDERREIGTIKGFI